VKGVKGQEWHSNAKLRARRRGEVWPLKSRLRARQQLSHADLTVRRLEEGVRYLLLANGAVLVASIGAFGGVWKQAELQRLLTKMVTLFSMGLAWSAVAWVISAVVIRDFLSLRQDITQFGYTPENWQAWNNLKRSTFFCLMVMALGFGAILFFNPFSRP
jgi:hypothetical protein